MAEREIPASPPSLPAIAARGRGIAPTVPSRSRLLAALLGLCLMLAGRDAHGARAVAAHLLDAYLVSPPSHRLEGVRTIDVQLPVPVWTEAGRHSTARLGAGFIELLPDAELLGGPDLRRSESLRVDVLHAPLVETDMSRILVDWSESRQAVIVRG